MGKKAPMLLQAYKNFSRGAVNLAKNPDAVRKVANQVGQHGKTAAGHATTAALLAKSGDYGGASKYAARAVKHSARGVNSANNLYRLSKTKRANNVAAHTAGRAAAKSSAAPVE